MKIIRFLSLLRNDARWIGGALAFSIYICAQSVLMHRTDHMFSLSMSSNGTDIFLLIIPSMCVNVLFLSGSQGIRNQKLSSFGILEFFFSKAISRVEMFCSKTLIYLLLILLPLAFIWIYSSLHPLVRVELPYRPVESREATKQFYLQHFEGAYVQKDETDREGNKAYVVLPTATETWPRSPCWEHWPQGYFFRSWPLLVR